MEPMVKRQRTCKPMTEPAKRALKSMCAGMTPAEHASTHLIKEASAWTYYCLAAATLEGDDLLELARPLIPSDAWEVLSALKGEPVFGGPLKELIERVNSSLDDGGEYHSSEHKASQVRLARLILDKQ